MVDAGLVTQNPVTLERVPVLAEELPSVKKGTWKIDLQKKTMVTVYKLRPNLKWHDGKPYTSKDFEFGWQIAKHPEFPMPRSPGAGDDRQDRNPRRPHHRDSLEDLYNEAYAIQYTHVRAFPRHLLQDAFQARRYEGVCQSAVLEQKLCRRRARSACVEWDGRPHGARSLQ